MATKDVEMSSHEHEPVSMQVVKGPLVTVNNVVLTASPNFTEAMDVKLEAIFHELVDVEFEVIFSPNGVTHEQTLLKRPLKADSAGRCEFIFQIPAPALLLPDGKSAIPPEDLPSDTNNLELAGLVMFFKYKSKVFCVVGYLLELTRGSAGLERRLARTPDGKNVQQEVTFKPINWNASAEEDEKVDEKAADQDRRALDAAYKLFVGMSVVAPGSCAKVLSALLPPETADDEEAAGDDFIV